MKKLAYIFLPVLLVACGGAESEETTENEVETDTTTVVEEEPDNKSNRKSPRMNKSGDVFGLTIGLDYGSPRVKGRTIWGDLVPYDKVWRAGADEVSAISFNQAAFFGGEEIEPGTYGMFIIPKENEDWVFILNEEWSKEEHDVWGAYDYKEDKDVLRLDVTPEWMPDSAEELSYDITDDGNLEFTWEKVKLTISVGPVTPS